MDGPTFNQEYLQRLIDGNEDTVRHFFDHFNSVLGAKLRRQGLPAQDVDEIRQETLYRVFRGVSAVEQPERLGAYVFGVCRNVVHENQRSGWRYQSLPDDMPELLDLSWRPEEAWVTEDRKRQVGLVLSEIPEKDRRLLRGLFLDERDKDDLCREFGVDREYLRVLLHRAMTKARVILLRNPQANA